MLSSSPPPQDIKAIVIGATGLIGQQLVQQLQATTLDAQTNVVAIVRRHPAQPLSRVHYHVIPDFMELHAAIAQMDLSQATAYSALGTTLKQAGSREAFRQVDYDFNLAFAKAVHQAGCRRYALVSAVGAKANSPFFYNQVKGELENAVQALDFEQIVFARPSLLLGEHPDRFFENVAQQGFKFAKRWLPQTFRYRPIEAERVAQALIQTLPPDAHQGASKAPRVQILSNEDMLKMTLPAIHT